MALKDLLTVTKGRKKIGLSEERAMAMLPNAQKYIAFWREYPDLFIDFLKGPNSTFNLYFYQRVFLRAICRNKYSYMTFPRAYSKSFIAILGSMIKCVLYPGSKLFICSGGKEQAASIATEKIKELQDLIPALNRELDLRPGKTQFQKDYVRLIFKNGSQLDIVAARDSARGGRRHGGLLEECILIDADALNKVIIPLMNVSRALANGERSDGESPLNKSQVYVTTAGWKNTFAYDKLIQILLWQVMYPGKSIAMGGTWRIPVLMGLLDKNFINDLKADSTFDESSFSREYESIWAGASEDAFFSSDMFDHNRKLNQPEYEYSNRSSKNAYYVISLDVGRKGDNSVATVIKTTPQAEGDSIKSIVNIYPYEDEHFEDLTIKVKKLYFKYKARTLVIDGNGMGIGVLDYMVKNQTDPDTGELIPNFGIENDEEGYYKKYKNADTILDAIYIVKANAPLNTEMHSNVKIQMRTNKIKFLIDERTAKTKLMETKAGQNMSIEARTEYLKPFTLTSILKEEMMNLREENEGQNIILKQSNKKIKKDKFSSLEYGLYYIKLQDGKKKRKGSRFTGYSFFN